MSIAYKCDICGAYVDEATDSQIVAQKQVSIQGTPVDISLVVKVDAFSGAKPTHVCSDTWIVIMQKVKQYIETHWG